MNRLFNNIKTKFTLRGTALALATMLLFTTVVVQPAQAQSVVNSLKCSAISAFASVTTATLQLGQAAMNAAFQLEINLLSAAWQIQDSAISVIRSISEQAFLATFAVFSLFVFNPVKKAALNTYKDTLLNAIHLLETKVDAIRASFREDFMALLKAHQKALTNLVNTLISTITGALNTAQTHCADKGVVTTLLSVIAQANITLVVKGLAQDANDLVKALTLVARRNSGYLQVDGEFFNTATSATVTLIGVLLTGKPAPSPSPTPAA